MTQEFMKALDGKLRFDTDDTAFCAQYSWFGVSKGDRLGVEKLWLFYNRFNRLLSPDFLTFRIERSDGACETQKTRADLPLEIREDDGRGFSGRAIFARADVLCYHAKLDKDSGASTVTATLTLPATDPPFRRNVIYNAAARRLTIQTRLPRSDARDPDVSHPLTLRVLVPEAFSGADIIADGRALAATAEGMKLQAGGSVVVQFTASGSDFAGTEQTFVIGVGEGPTASKIAKRMVAVGRPDSAASYASSVDWLTKALDKFTFDGIPESLRAHYANAVYQILSNTKAPRGRIKHLAVYPSRGTYCAHYLWDSCFTNLGVAQFNQELAEGYLRILCENQEEDGKMPHFVCATWNRPRETQPPLIAWSAWRLYERFRNRKFVAAVYGPLCRMVDWWFANRDRDGDGLVECDTGFEVGWDDSPRFDQGRVAAVDINSYLNREMRMLVKMAPLAGRGSQSARWSRRAADHAKMMRSRLFDRTDGVFYDRLVAENRLRKVLSPASLLPLWTGVPMPKETARRMIEDYLLNPEHFFGPYPFPSVAYSDPTYDSARWWKGPVWPVIAWAMADTLRAHGYEKEYREAVRRLADMMAREGLCELFDSESGKGSGSPAICWTCSVFMDLAREYRYD